MRVAGVLGLPAVLLMLGLAILATSAPGSEVAGPEGPPTFNWWAAHAERIVVADVWVRERECKRGGRPSGGDRACTPVDLVVERTIVADSLGVLPDTLHSFAAGGSYLDDQGRKVTELVEDEPFRKHQGLRCLLLLRLDLRPPDAISARPLYLPTEIYNIYKIVGEDIVRELKLKPGRNTGYEDLPLAECVKRILAARAAPHPAAPRK